MGALWIPAGDGGAGTGGRAGTGAKAGPFGRGRSADGAAASFPAQAEEGGSRVELTGALGRGGEVPVTVAPARLAVSRAAGVRIEAGVALANDVRSRAIGAVDQGAFASPAIDGRHGHDAAFAVRIVTGATGGESPAGRQGIGLCGDFANQDGQKEGSHCPAFGFLKTNKRP